MMRVPSSGAYTDCTDQHLQRGICIEYEAPALTATEFASTFYVATALTETALKIHQPVF